MWGEVKSDSRHVLVFKKVLLEWLRVEVEDIVMDVLVHRMSLVLLLKII